MKTQEYPWHDAPEWAQYAAVDQDGRAWWFDVEPAALAQYPGSWVIGEGGKFSQKIGRTYPFQKDWMLSIEQRPQQEKKTMIPFTYPWYRAPSWANWAATDEDGRAWWYEKRPILDDCSWGLDREEGIVANLERYIPHPEAATYWRESLQPRQPLAQRPEALAALRSLTPADLDAMSDRDLEDFNRLCHLWSSYSTETLDMRICS